MLGIQRLAGKTESLYRRANNPYMEKWIIDQRSAFMPVQIPKGSDGARVMIDLLKNDTSLGVLVDQMLGRGDPIDFSGRATKAPSASIKLARRFTIFLSFQRLSDGAKTAPIKFISCNTSSPPFMFPRRKICSKTSTLPCDKFMTCSSSGLLSGRKNGFGSIIVGNNISH